MSVSEGDRERQFPAIEKKYGEKMAYWFDIMKKLEGKKYPEQISYLRENYGFSQSHANALVMYSRGSISAKRHASPAAYFKSIDPKQAKKVREIFKVITTKYPKLELVVAWNQPMLKLKDSYIIGIGVATHHIIIGPWGDVIETFGPKFALLEGVKVKKKTIAIPNDWVVDTKLIQSMVAARIKELK